MLEGQFRLVYKTQGGSGTNLTLSEVLELDWGEMQWWLERLETERANEDKAIRRGSPSR